jgi:hypothetical protein
MVNTCVFTRGYMSERFHRVKTESLSLSLFLLYVRASVCWEGFARIACTCGAKLALYFLLAPRAPIVICCKRRKVAPIIAFSPQMQQQQQREPELCSPPPPTTRSFAATRRRADDGACAAPHPSLSHELGMLLQRLPPMLRRRRRRKVQQQRADQAEVFHERDKLDLVRRSVCVVIWAFSGRRRGSSDCLPKKGAVHTQGLGLLLLAFQVPKVVHDRGGRHEEHEL